VSPMKSGMVIILSLVLLSTGVVGEERTPQALIDQMLQHYGKKFSGHYVEGLSLVVRVREKGIQDVISIVEPQLANPAKLSSGSQISGRLIFAEMAAANARAKELTLEAANLAFNEYGEPLKSMPFHNEMSDAVFMGCPIMARAGQITGERKYFDQSVANFKFMQNLCLRADGIYRHSPLHESAWGRGNGFPAIGLAMVLESLPKDHPEHDFVVKSLQDHLRALKPHQDQGGMWHQVIDHPESYPEFTSTCMISYAALVAIRLGYLEKKEWQDRLLLSWKAIDQRVSADGKEVRGSCTGTGKQTSLEAYLTRPEINGYDDRAGSMALLFAHEMKRFLEKP
jgi:unsaturated rhamnogalacturonyl hydrolase